MCVVGVACCTCPMDAGHPDAFDGREYMGTRGRATMAALFTPHCREADAAGSAAPPNTSRRNIVAKGMKRFEGIGKVAPPQRTVERLSPRVLCILGCNPGPYTLNGTNCFLVGTGAKRVLIDAGDNPVTSQRNARNHKDFMKVLKSTLAAEECSLSMILVTHLHGDHFGGVRGILDEFGRDIAVGMLEAPEHTMTLWTMRELRARGLVDACAATPNPLLLDHVVPDDAPMPDFDTSWDIAGRSVREIARDFHYARHHVDFYEEWADSTNPAINGVKLQHGEVIKIEGATLRVVETPGHAENHAAFCLDEEHSIFSGDNVLGYGTTIMIDAFDYMASLGAMQQYKPVRLYPGHGPFIADGKGLLDRYHAHRQSREDQVVSLLEDAAMFGEGTFLPTAKDIAEKLYTNTSPSRMEQARQNVERIVLKLWREGRAEVFTDRTGQVKALVPQLGYLARLGDDLAWKLVEQSAAAAESWAAKINSIVQATRDGSPAEQPPRAAAAAAAATLQIPSEAMAHAKL
mmetsp:Transcript_22909/g.59784  ORF Transcript_22909/g.59784 Transcript_22909/m.59784 type:complete len:518 (+) Transcript_22909:127-1680(+)